MSFSVKFTFGEGSTVCLFCESASPRNTSLNHSVSGPGRTDRAALHAPSLEVAARLTVFVAQFGSARCSGWNHAGWLRYRFLNITFCTGSDDINPLVQKV